MKGRIAFDAREKRSKKLLSLSEKKYTEFCLHNVGTIADVLFEHVTIEGKITGFTGNYLRTEYPFKPDLAGVIKKVKLKSIADSGRMEAEIID
jgi:threonylcarbamoyladenosine tRNA methylthiotransferase MtaB